MITSLLALGCPRGRMTQDHFRPFFHASANLVQRGLLVRRQARGRVGRGRRHGIQRGQIGRAGHLRAAWPAADWRPGPRDSALPARQSDSRSGDL